MSVPVLAPRARVATAERGGSRSRELRELARTTPGVLTLLMVALVIVSVVVGVFTALGVQRRAHALDELATHSGPLSVAAQEIYRSLSDADATATSAFLAGGLETPAARARYLADIAQAEASLAVAVAAREPADMATRDSPLAVLSGRLSVYTGLVETARAVNRQGLPLGAAYQREASHLMRSELLPAAQRLYATETGRVAADQDSAGGFPVPELLLGLLALGVLVVAQLYLRRNTRRMFNIGLMAATAAALVSLVWVLVASTAVLANVGQSRDDGSAQTDVLARARIAALAARADETLTLVARGSGDEYEEHYGQVSGATENLLSEAESLATSDDVRALVSGAADSRQAWAEAHERIRDADDGGDYTRAVELAISSGEAAPTSFDALDTRLGEAIGHTTATFNDEVAQARGAMSGAVAGVILLAVLTAAGAVAGIWQRLKEYR